MARRVGVRLLVAFASLTVAAAASAQSRAPRTVLAIHWGPEDFPVTPIVNEAIRDALRADADGPIAFFTEYLESDLFPPDDAAAALAESIRRKFRGRHIDVVMAVADPALQFVLEHRDDLFPEAPIVFSGVGVPDAVGRSAGPGLAAVTRGAAYAETLKAALDLHPQTEQVYVVAVGADDRTVAAVHAALRGFEQRVRLSYAEADTVPALLAAVAALQPRSLVLFVWYAPNDQGSSQVVRALAAASPVPVYGTNENYVGLGVIGGVVRGTRETGARMGEMARQILHGTRAQDIGVESARLVPLFDWRQLQRWGVDEASLPPGSRIVFRAVSPWREYRMTIVSAIAAGVIQFALIVGLLYQRRARRRAELQSRNDFAIIAHLERQLALGALASAMAHELNQPLGSILHNAQAAELLLTSKQASTDELREILREIHREDTRASQIIQRHRALLKKHQTERRSVDLNAVVRESLAIVAHDAASRQIRLDAEPWSAPCIVIGDQVLLQQAVINLVLNAMDAMARTPASRRRVIVRITSARGGVEVAVRDYGAGIAAEVAGRLFEPFTSTKAAGMGVGLAIVRGIVESHGGTIKARNDEDGGAEFVFTVPAAPVGSGLTGVAELAPTA